MLAHSVTFTHTCTQSILKIADKDLLTSFEHIGNESKSCCQIPDQTLAALSYGKL